MILELGLSKNKKRINILIKFNFKILDGWLLLIDFSEIICSSKQKSIKSHEKRYKLDLGLTKQQREIKTTEETFNVFIIVQNTS